MNSTNHLQVGRPKRRDQFSQPQLNREPNVDEPLNSLRCIECKQPITSAPLSFGGAFACESCVIGYYQQHGPEVVKQELRERRVCAACLLRH
jgi:hypothetical protein